MLDKKVTEGYYIAFFLFLVILVSWFAGKKTAFYMLMVVLLGVLISRWNQISALQTKITGKA